MITDKNILFLLWSRSRWCLLGDLFRWRDHKWKTPVPHTKVGCWRGCRQKTLGGYLITTIIIMSIAPFLPVFLNLKTKANNSCLCSNWPMIYCILFSEQVPRVLPIRQDIQLWHIWLRRVESDRLRFHAVERTLSSSWSHDQGVSAVWKINPPENGFSLPNLFHVWANQANQAYQAYQEHTKHTKSTPRVHTLQKKDVVIFFSSGYQWGKFRRILLHLLPEIKFNSWRILFSSE